MSSKIAALCFLGRDCLALIRRYSARDALSDCRKFWSIGRHTTSRSQVDVS